MPDLSAKIEQVANRPASVSVDGVSTTQHDLTKLIEADRYLASKAAAARNHLGLRFVKLCPPGGG